jgi:hypothetical protein
MAIWNILQTFGIFYDHLVQCVFIWYIFSGFGIMHQEKSGKPDSAHFSSAVAPCKTREEKKRFFAAKKINFLPPLFLKLFSARAVGQIQRSSTKHVSLSAKLARFYFRRTFENTNQRIFLL